MTKNSYCDGHLMAGKNFDGGGEGEGGEGGGGGGKLWTWVEPEADSPCMSFSFFFAILTPHIIHFWNPWDVVSTLEGCTRHLVTTRKIKWSRMSKMWVFGGFWMS